MSSSVTVPKSALPQRRAQSFISRLKSGEELAYLITVTAAAVIILLTALVLYELIAQSGQARHKFGWSFLFTSTWDPVAGDYGALPFIYGTVVTSVMALLIAIPFGLGAAIFLAEMAPPKISNAMTFLIELLAAVPSVIYGVLGIFVLVPALQKSVVPAIKSVAGSLPIFQGTFYGVSVFSAGIVLSVMIVPFIISVSREVLLAVPRDQREASLALGASQWQTIWRVVMPNASTGITGSIFLALARALGETMAVTMVIGNAPQIKASLLAPGNSIASMIASSFTEATDDLFLSALVELGLVLFGVTFVLNGLARILIMTTQQKGAHK
ncbi:MAG TPA: phosphate ABC transporter permease subunit PstC [Candidatus Acidoferrales bacterium]|jgi:phosphate transport system permease protein|nr:phosphate ABC transporter permease subunit PstC [Candidatus Acidoferrales bacterium]